MNEQTEMTEAEWDTLSEREKRHLAEDHLREYLAELSPQDRARVEWEQT